MKPYSTATPVNDPRRPSEAHRIPPSIAASTGAAQTVQSRAGQTTGAPTRATRGTSLDATRAAEGRTAEARLKILFLTPNYFPGPGGGTERQAKLQAEELARRGHSVTVYCPRSEGSTSGPIAGVFVRRLPHVLRRPFTRASYYTSLAMFLLANARRYDVLHVHLANVQAEIAVAAALLWRRPVYAKVAAGGETGDIARSPTPFLRRRFGLIRAATVQAIAGDIASDLLAAGVSPERVVQIPNGYDASQFHPDTARDRSELRRSLDLPCDGPVVLYAGRLASYKGVLDLVDIWKATAPGNALLVLLGTWETSGYIGEFEMPPGIIVREWATNVIDYYRAADVFVLPSYREGMSNALLEAMACGVPVVASRVGAAAEMIEDGESGLLIDAGSKQQIEEALGRLLADPSLRARLAEAAAVRIRDRYGIASVVDRIEARYRQLLDGRPSRPAPRPS